MFKLGVIQARMNSKRLPGKVLADIVGKPLLWHIVNRLKFSRLLDKVVVATSVNPQDDSIERVCKECGIEIYRGSEEDLIDRFYQTSKKYKAQVVVRITGDCAVVDPRWVDKVLSFFISHIGEYEYVSNSRPISTLPHGLEIEAMDASLLEKLWIEIKDPFRREWFTTVIFENPQKYKIYCLKNEEDLSWMRLVVDYPEDLELIRYIYKNLYSPDKCFYLQDILNLYSKNPHIFKINQKYRRDEQYFEELRKRGIKRGR